MADSRLLVSNYVSEDREENRRIARACNIAKWLIDNFPHKAGKRINVKDLRKAIPNQVKDTTLSSGGDLKAHGNAINALNLGRLTVGKETMVDISLPNLKRCTSWVLGQGQKVGAISLIRDEDEPEKLKAPKSEKPKTPEPVNQLEEDNALIDIALEIPAKNMSDWENNFVESLDQKWRRRGLSKRQRETLVKVIRERS